MSTTLVPPSYYVVTMEGELAREYRTVSEAAALAIKAPPRSRRARGAPPTPKDALMGTRTPLQIRDHKARQAAEAGGQLLRGARRS